MTGIVRPVRAYLARERGDVVADVEECADAVAATWDRDAVDDRRRVIEPLRRELDAAGVLAAFPGVLAGAANAAGYELPASPVPAPPYVVVTSRGPILRATLPVGRLVVRYDVFDVDRESVRAYRRLDGLELVVTVA